MSTCPSCQWRERVDIGLKRTIAAPPFPVSPTFADFAPLRLCVKFPAAPPSPTSLTFADFAPLRQISRPPTIPHCDKNRIPARLGQDRRGMRATLTPHSSLLSLKTALSRFLPPLRGQSERQIPHPYGGRADDRQRRRARTCQNPRLFLRCDCPRRPVTSPPRCRRAAVQRPNAESATMRPIPRWARAGTRRRPESRSLSRARTPRSAARMTARLRTPPPPADGRRGRRASSRRRRIRRRTRPKPRFGQQPHLARE